MLRRRLRLHLGHCSGTTFSHKVLMLRQSMVLVSLKMMVIFFVAGASEQTMVATWAAIVEDRPQSRLHNGDGPQIDGIQDPTLRLSLEKDAAHFIRDDLPRYRQSLEFAW